MQKYDIVVIGSGLGGLSSGALLTKAGYRVMVLEKSIQPGGCMQSYRRGGLHFDTGVHYVGGLEAGHPLYETFKELGLMELPWQRMDECYDHVIIGDREYDLAQGEESFVEHLAKAFPDYVPNIRKFVEKYHNIKPEDMDVNAWYWLKQTLVSDELVDVVSASSMKIELRQKSLPLFSFLHNTMSYMQSSWRLQGDGDLIVQKLSEVIREGGGDVVCNSGVTELRDDGERITSVLCGNGEEYTAEYFISDIHPGALCNLLNVAQRKTKLFRRRMQSCKNTCGIFTTSLVIKPETLTYRNHNAYIYNKEVWNAKDCVMVSSRYPKDPPSMDQQGRMYVRQIDLLTPMTWEECKPWEETTVGRRGDDYREMCEAKATECIRMAERFIPSLSDVIEKKFTSSPLTYRDYLSSPEGTAFGIRKDYRSSMLTYHSVKTPFRNLFLTGQNIILTGIEGVTMTARETVRQVMNENDNDNEN